MDIVPQLAFIDGEIADERFVTLLSDVIDQLRADDHEVLALRIVLGPCIDPCPVCLPDQSPPKRGIRREIIGRIRVRLLVDRVNQKDPVVSGIRLNRSVHSHPFRIGVDQLRIGNIQPADVIGPI